MQITRQANSIFKEVFEKKDVPFMLATPDGMQSSNGSAKTKLERRVEVGVNTFITPADFPENSD